LQEVADRQAKMAGEPTYLPPYIPKTPSQSINTMLQDRCGRGFDQLFKAFIAYYICGIFTAINNVYGKLNKDTSRASYTKWTTSCGIVAVLALITAYLFYQSVLGLLFTIDSIFFYIGSFIYSIIIFVFSILVKSLKLAAIAGVIGTSALCVSGMAFFDKKGNKAQ